MLTHAHCMLAHYVAHYSCSCMCTALCHTLGCTHTSLHTSSTLLQVFGHWTLSCTLSSCTALHTTSTSLHTSYHSFTHELHCTMLRQYTHDSYFPILVHFSVTHTHITHMTLFDRFYRLSLFHRCHLFVRRRRYTHAGHTHDTGVVAESSGHIFVHTHTDLDTDTEVDDYSFIYLFILSQQHTFTHHTLSVRFGPCWYATACNRIRLTGLICWKSACDAALLLSWAASKQDPHHMLTFISDSCIQ